MQNQTALLSFFLFFFIFFILVGADGYKIRPRPLRCMRIPNTTVEERQKGQTDSEPSLFAGECWLRARAAAIGQRPVGLGLGGEGRALRRDSVAAAVAVAVAVAVRAGLLAWFTGVILQLQIELRLSRWVFSSLPSLRDLTKPKCQRRRSAWEGAKGSEGRAYLRCAR